MYIYIFLYHILNILTYYTIIDVDKVSIEKAEKTKVQQFVFALTNKDGNRSYGICLRGLFRGEGRRFDVKRRPRHCLCIITKFPYFSMFQTLLLQIYSMALLDKTHASAKRILEVLIDPKNATQNNSFFINVNPIDNISEFLSPSFSPANNQYHFLLPSSDKGGHQDVALLPLLEILGIDNFFLILSAVLNENRIIFIANEADTLSNAMLAVVSMIHPFTWKYLFLPVLPTKLLTYAAAPYPFLIGIRRYQLPQLYKQELGNVVLIDLDSGDCSTRGVVNVRDIVGDSGTALKQASEALDFITRKAGGFATKLMKSANLMSSSGGSETQSTSNKDVMASIINDLRSFLATKPGGSSLQAMTTGLMRNIAGSSTSSEAAKIYWELEGERVVRENLLLLFVYLFYDLEGAINNNYLAQHSSGVAKKPVGVGSRAINIHGSQAYDLNLFIQKKTHSGSDSREILNFLQDFVRTSMFDQFCDDSIRKLGASHKQADAPLSTKLRAGAGGYSDDGLYDIVCDELKSKGSLANVANIKQIISTIRDLQDKLQASDAGLDAQSKLKGLYLHSQTVQMTGGSVGVDPQVSSRRSSNTVSTESPAKISDSSGNTLDIMIQNICNDTYDVSSFPKIMKTILVRLNCCKVANGRGSSGIAGRRTLTLLRALLVEGSPGVLGACLDLIPVLRSLIHLQEKKTETVAGEQTGAAPSAFDISLSTNYSQDIRPRAKEVLRLILDHNLLKLQRNYSFLSRSGLYQFHRISITMPRDPFGISNSGRLPSFVALHNKCKPIPESNITADLCKYDFVKTKPSTAQDDDNDNEVDDYMLPTLSHQSSAASVDSVDLILFDGTESAGHTNTTNSTFSNFSNSFPPQQHRDDGFSFTEDMKFRVVNKDSGEIFDIRYDIDKTMPTKSSKMIQPSQLPLPPPPGSVRRPDTDFNRPFFPTQASYPVPEFSASTSMQPPQTSQTFAAPSAYPPQAMYTSTGPARPTLKPPMQIQGQGPPPLAISRMLSHEASFSSPLVSQAFSPSLGAQQLARDAGSVRDIVGSSHSIARDVKITPKDPFSGLVDVKKL